MSALFGLNDFLFEIFAHTALIAGTAVLFLQKKKKGDHSTILPYITIPLIPLGLVAAYFIGAELFISWYGENKFEADALDLRFTGPYAFYFIINLIGIISTQMFWLPALRRSAVATLIVGLLNSLP